MRVFLLFIFGLSSLFLGSGCRPSNSDQSKGGTSFVFARGSDAQKLDPADVDDGESVNTLAQICEGLLRFKPGGLEIEPWLAESYEVAENGTAIDFKIRPGVVFHDGAPLDAEAAAYSFLRQLDPSHPAHLPNASFQYWKYLFQDIESVEVVDAMTLRFKLSRPNSTLLYSLATFPAWLISPRSDLGTLQQKPIGTGPYQFSDWKPGEVIILDKNKNYWKQSNPSFDRVLFKTVPDNASRLLELKAGRIHALDGLQPIEALALEQDTRFSVYRRPGMNVGYLAFNMDQPRMERLTVRKLLSLAINRQAIVDLALDGAAQVAGYPLPPEFLGHPGDSTTPPIQHNLESAKALLAECPELLEKPLVLSTFNAPRPYFPDPVKVASLIRSDLEKLGLKVEIETRDFKSHLHVLRNGEFEMGLIGWIGDNGDTDNFLSVFFASWAAKKGAATNYSFYRNPEMDALLLKAREAVDTEVRANLYRDALGLWGNDLPLLPLVHAEQLVVMRREVRGFQLHPTGNLFFGPISWRE